MIGKHLFQTLHARSLFGVEKRSGHVKIVLGSCAHHVPFRYGLWRQCDSTAGMRAGRCAGFHSHKATKDAMAIVRQSMSQAGHHWVRAYRKFSWCLRTGFSVSVSGVGILRAGVEFVPVDAGSVWGRHRLVRVSPPPTVARSVDGPSTVPHRTQPCSKNLSPVRMGTSALSSFATSPSGLRTSSYVAWTMVVTPARLSNASRSN